MTKKDLRLKYQELRQKISAAEADEMSIAIANQILKLDIWDKTYFHLFLPIKKQNEVNTEYVLQILQGKDKEIVVSKSDFANCEMQHFLLTDNTKIKENKYGIPEPTNGIQVPTDMLDVIFVPLLAYDFAGNRVGYGKGFYDKLLSKCKPDTIKIGLSFFDPEDQIPNVNNSDIRLDYCVTGSSCYAF